MLFPGDIETEGWDNVNTCYPNMKKSDYYCISHHGSVNGHVRIKCNRGGYIQKQHSAWTCAGNSKAQILMGRNKAFSGIFSQSVLNSFGQYGNLHITEMATNYIKLDWKTGLAVFQ